MKKVLLIIVWILSFAFILAGGYFFFYMWENFSKFKWMIIAFSGIGYLISGVLLFLWFADREKLRNSIANMGNDKTVT